MFGFISNFLRALAHREENTRALDNYYRIEYANELDKLPPSVKLFRIQDLWGNYTYEYKIISNQHIKKYSTALKNYRGLKR